MSLLLGIDVGTTGTKALLLDTERGVVAEAERPSTLHRPSRLGGGGYGGVVGKRMRDHSRAEEGALEIAGVGVSGMVPCTILLDEHLRPLRRSIQQNDARTVREVEELKARFAGTHPGTHRLGDHAAVEGPPLLWLAEHEPETWKRTRTVVGSYDYISMWL